MTMPAYTSTKTSTTFSMNTNSVTSKFFLPYILKLIVNALLQTSADNCYCEQE